MPSYGQANTDSATRQLQARTDGRTDGRTTHLEKNPLVPERTGEIDSIRILTVRQPWAWAIIHGGKDVENRVRNIAGSYRGPVAIHAGLRWDSDEDGTVPMTPDQVADAIESKGHIIGVVDLVDVHWSGMECSRGVACHEYDLCSSWAEPYAHHMVLANPRPLVEPIPFKGALGLRTLAADIAAQVWAGVA